jgi:DNA-binding response OmpR family regulator
MHVKDAIFHSMKKYTPAPYVARILVIEDRPEEMRLLLDTLREERFQISIAFEGMQGYGRAVAQRPDLILLDVHLGQTDGFAICRLLKADPSTSHIPLIFVSSAISLPDRLTGLRAGAVDYIQKPFEPAEVLARMQMHLKLSDSQPHMNEPPEPELMFSENSDQFLVKAAARYITANLARMPTLPEIARSVGTHEKRLTKAFRFQKGMSVFEFVREQRLILARKLLTQTPMTIADIAAETGFSSPANFSTAFKAVSDLSPTQYRQRQAQQSLNADAA